MSTLVISDNQTVRELAEEAGYTAISPEKSVDGATPIALYEIPDSEVQRTSARFCRVAPFRINGKCPIWALQTPFRVGVVPEKFHSPKGMKESRETLRERLREAIAKAINHQVAAASSPESMKAALEEVEHRLQGRPQKDVKLPWGSLPREEEHLRELRDWLCEALEWTEQTANPLASAIRATGCRMQEDEPYPPSNTPLATMLCPPYLNDGRIGRVEHLSDERVQGLISFFQHFREEYEKEGGELPPITAYLPGEELAYEPLKFVLNPVLWNRGREALERDLKRGRLILQYVLDTVTKETGVEFRFRSYGDVASYVHTYKYHLKQRNSIPIEDLTAFLMDPDNALSRNSTDVLYDFSLWSSSLYLSLAASLPQGTCIIDLEVVRRHWQVVWPLLREDGISISVCWPPRSVRQHYNRT